HLIPRRARRTGNVFYGCSNYPKCDYTTNFEPVGALHDTDDGPVAKHGDTGICLRCGAAIPLVEGVDVVGRKLEGGPPNPEALAKPARGGARRGRSAGGSGAKGGGRSGEARPGARGGARRTTRSAGAAPDA
ncbi:MAG TPA: topoisomerase DNA-binding C4 zinc finger domain-containing protein, partial [Candidatus Limnocylindrales bacterium]|nr:topoisomerase DNA-binding C4 zinc finger domain-containing protein [Candidatus Limnocylindrales bacterium]